MQEIPTTRPFAGILWMLASGLSFVAVTGIVRYLGTDLPAPQSAFVRFAFGVFFVLPALWPLIAQGLPAGTLLPVIGRGAVHCVAVICWFFAMARLPVAEVTAIGYLTPVCVTIGAALVFRERLAARRLLAIAVAFIGAMIVLRPGLREISPGHLAQVVAAVGFAGSYLFAKRLTGIMPPAMIVGLLSVTVTIALTPLAVAVWVPMGWAQAGWLAVVAGLATLGHYCMTRSFALAPIAATQPVTFLQLVWATLLGLLVFGEAVDPFVLLGGAVIIAAVSYITWREFRLRKRNVTPPSNAGKF